MIRRKIGSCYRRGGTWEDMRRDGEMRGGRFVRHAFPSAVFVFRRCDAMDDDGGGGGD